MFYDITVGLIQFMTVETILPLNHLLQIEHRRAPFVGAKVSISLQCICLLDLQAMCASKKPEELTFTQLKAKLDGQYGTNKLAVAERYQF